MDSQNCVAIVLAAGSGKRMNTEVKKQYLLMDKKPVLYYSLHTFQESPIISEIILVTASEDIAYCTDEIVDKYQFTKVTKIITGGAQRYDSVYEGIKEIARGNNCDYVFIHDGARPFVDQQMLAKAYQTVVEAKACVVGVKSKDTVKISDNNDNIYSTPERSHVWIVQTPQVFAYQLICDAYIEFMNHQSVGITDDAMVVERFGGQKVRLVEGSYENIKITTPEDLSIAEALLRKRKNEEKTS